MVDRNSLKKDNFGKDKSENDNYEKATSRKGHLWKRNSVKGQLWESKFCKIAILSKRQSENDNSKKRNNLGNEKEEILKRALLKRTSPKSGNSGNKEETFWKWTLLRRNYLEKDAPDNEKTFKTCQGGNERNTILKIIHLKTDKYGKGK